MLIASCAILGFIIAYKTLDLGGEEWKQSGIASFFGPNLRANLLFMFGLTFLIPFLNLPIIIFGYFKTTAALRALEKYENEKSEREAKKWLKWKKPGDEKLDYRVIDFPGFSPASPNDAPQAAQPNRLLKYWFWTEKLSRSRVTYPLATSKKSLVARSTKPKVRRREVFGGILAAC